MPVGSAVLSSLASTDAGRKKSGYAIDANVLTSIRSASRATGVDFGYLMAEAAQESSFQPSAKASSSSAEGLYQFIDPTWLRMVAEHGADYGLGRYAAAIKANADGSYHVDDPKLRQEILNLRKDPHIAAELGAEFALGNKQELEDTLGHKVGATELYLAHFLGASGAAKFLTAIERNSGAKADTLLPNAAEANPSVFYDANGRARTVGEIYQAFSRSIEGKASQFTSLADGAPINNGSASASFKGNYRNSQTGYANASSSGNSTSQFVELPRGPQSVSFLVLLELASLDTPHNANATSETHRSNAAQSASDNGQSAVEHNTVKNAAGYNATSSDNLNAIPPNAYRRGAFGLNQSRYAREI